MPPYLDNVSRREERSDKLRLEQANEGEAIRPLRYNQTKKGHDVLAKAKREGWAIQETTLSTTRRFAVVSAFCQAPLRTEGTERGRGGYNSCRQPEARMHRSKGEVTRLPHSSNLSDLLNLALTLALLVLALLVLELSLRLLLPLAPFSRPPNPNPNQILNPNAPWKCPGWRTPPRRP